MCAIGIALFKSNHKRKVFVSVMLILFFVVFDIVIYHEKLYGHFMEFFFGIIVYNLWRRNIVYPRLAKTFTGIVLILIVSGHLYYNSLDFTYLRFIVFGIPSGLILYTVLSLESQWPSSKLATLLGDASYSIYISHTFVLKLLYLGFNINRGEAVFFDIFTFLTALIAGVLIFKVLETPITKWLKKIVV